MPVKNKERKSARISLIIMAIGILAVVLPYLLNADMERYGFAAAFVGLILAITAFLVFLMFRGRAKVLDRMFYNENVLAHWTYSKEFWDQVQKQDKDDSKIGRVVGFFLGGIFALIGFIVFAADPDENIIFLFIMLGLAVFFILIGFIAARREKKRAETIMPEAIIAQEGVLYKDILYTWNAPAVAYLESVSIHPAAPDTILFVLKRLSGTRATMIRFRRSYIAIPIPLGQKQSADYIVDYFDLPMSEWRRDRMKEAGSEDIQEDDEEYRE